MHLRDAADTESLGARIAGALLAGDEPGGGTAAHIHLSGPLGAGKTTLVRGLARALGIEAPVKSPTYTLVEPYDCPAAKRYPRLYHFDLYRLSDGEELEYLGARDIFAEAAICVIEWPERGGDWLPRADLELYLRIAGQGREVELTPGSPRGAALIAGLGNSPGD
jgi:tRNA threonylcarbamoyladenosine biosynthesis protein TsaE